MEVKIIETDTYSQLGQDLWVLEETNNKRDGYFVDFGATDGITINNTYLLEKDFGWNGIVAECHPDYFDDLAKNRRCVIDHNAVFTETDKQVVLMAPEVPDISSIRGYGDDDEFAEARRKGTPITVPTITLFDLLELHKAPTHIDYLSVDTEGSEYDILKAFFDNEQSSKYHIQLITVEHNYTEARRKIHDLLLSHGYELAANKQWDDFYRKVS
jgi:FkbM family methyltransferase